MRINQIKKQITAVLKNRSIIVFTFLVAGFALRIYALGHESLWLDEAYTRQFANLDLFHVFANQENNPPLYFLIMHWWIMLFGDSEFSLRLPSVIFGCLAVIMIYRVGKNMFNEDTGVLGCILLTLSAFHIAFSREARTFSLTVLLTLLSVYFLIKILQKNSGKMYFASYLLFSCLLMYSHIYGIFIIISQNIFVITSFFFPSRKRTLQPRQWIILQAILTILFSAWIPIFLDRISFVQAGFWIKQPGAEGVYKTLRTYCNGSVVLMCLYAGLAVQTIAKRLLPKGISLPDPGNGAGNNSEVFSGMQKTYFLLLWLCVPIILPFLVSLFSTPIYHIKYTIVSLPAFYLLIARAVTSFRIRFVKTVLVLSVIVFSLPPLYWYHTTVHKAQWKEAVAYIDTHAGSDDLLLFNSFICKELLFDYYSSRKDLKACDDRVKKDIAERYRDNVDRRYLEDLTQIAGGHDRIWIVLSTSGKNRERIQKTLLETYRIYWQKQYVGIKVFLFEKRKTGPGGGAGNLGGHRGSYKMQ